MTFWEIFGLIALVPVALFAGYLALTILLGLTVGIGVTIKKRREK